MKNIRRDLYKELRVKDKGKKSTYNVVCKILTQNEIDVFNDLLETENDFVRKESREHYQKRYQWILVKREQEKKKPEDYIDGISFKDSPLPKEF